MKRIAIFASGRGSNAQKIINHFEQRSDAEIALIVSNKTTAPVLELAKENHIPSLIIDKQTFADAQCLRIFEDRTIDFIVLAGFLWKIPPYLVEAFPKKIINIHPALLPKYGGKGMYGMHVHKAVYNAKEKESGITIHFVNEQYDEGDIIFQAKCTLNEKDTPQDIAQKVLALEHQYFPQIIEKQLLGTVEEIQ